MQILGLDFTPLEISLKDTVESFEGDELVLILEHVHNFILLGVRLVFHNFNLLINVPNDTLNHFPEA